MKDYLGKDQRRTNDEEKEDKPIQGEYCPEIELLSHYFFDVDVADSLQCIVNGKTKSRNSSFDLYVNQVYLGIFWAVRGPLGKDICNSDAKSRFKNPCAQY